MAPKIDPVSDAYLIQRYDEMYNGSAEFRSRLHNIVTSSRSLTLGLDPGAGAAHYTPESNKITVWRQNAGGGNKTDTELRDDLFFELHNAKKSMAFDALRGSTGYNVTSLANDVKKAAGYALAVEWAEWINVAESTVLVDTVNNQAGVALLPSPAPYRASFNPGPTSWAKFSNYLGAQVGSGHTRSYDAAATGQQWKGYDILRVLTTNGRNNSDLEIYPNEIAPAAPQQPAINSRGNPFLWDLVKGMRLN